MIATDTIETPNESTEQSEATYKPEARSFPTAQLTRVLFKLASDIVCKSCGCQPKLRLLDGDPQLRSSYQVACPKCNRNETYSGLIPSFASRKEDATLSSLGEHDDADEPSEDTEILACEIDPNRVRTEREENIEETYGHMELAGVVRRRGLNGLSIEDQKLIGYEVRRIMRRGVRKHLLDARWGGEDNVFSAELESEAIAALLEAKQKGWATRLFVRSRLIDFCIQQTRAQWADLQYPEPQSSDEGDHDNIEFEPSKPFWESGSSQPRPDRKLWYRASRREIKRPRDLQLISPWCGGKRDDTASPMHRFAPLCDLRGYYRLKHGVCSRLGSCTSPLFDRAYVETISARVKSKVGRRPNVWRRLTRKRWGWTPGEAFGMIAAPGDKLNDNVQDYQEIGVDLRDEPAGTFQADVQVSLGEHKWFTPEEHPGIYNMVRRLRPDDPAIMVYEHFAQGKTYEQIAKSIGIWSDFDTQNYYEEVAADDERYDKYLLSLNPALLEIFKESAARTGKCEILLKDLPQAAFANAEGVRKRIERFIKKFAKKLSAQGIYFRQGKIVAKKSKQRYQRPPMMIGEFGWRWAAMLERNDCVPGVRVKLGGKILGKQQHVEKISVFDRDMLRIETNCPHAHCDGAQWCRHHKRWEHTWYWTSGPTQEDNRPSVIQKFCRLDGRPGPVYTLGLICQTQLHDFKPRDLGDTKRPVSLNGSRFGRSVRFARLPVLRIPAWFEQLLSGKRPLLAPLFVQPLFYRDDSPDRRTGKVPKRYIDDLEQEKFIWQDIQDRQHAVISVGVIEWHCGRRSWSDHELNAILAARCAEWKQSLAARAGT